MPANTKKPELTYPDGNKNSQPSGGTDYGYTWLYAKTGQGINAAHRNTACCSYSAETGSTRSSGVPFIAEAGNAIFSNMPLLFAMGIAAGLSEDDAGAAVLAGAVGYFVLTASAKTINADINMSFFAALLPV